MNRINGEGCWKIIIDDYSVLNTALTDWVDEFKFIDKGTEFSFKSNLFETHFLRSKIGYCSMFRGIKIDRNYLFLSV